MAHVGLIESGTKHRLAEAELEVLRDEAKSQMRHSASDMVRSYDPEKNGRPEVDIQSEERDLLLAAAAVYGVLRNAELAFGTHRGPASPPEEFVDVEFSTEATEWLRERHREIRPSLEQARGSVEIANYEDGSGTARRTFLLFVLDGIFAGEAV